MACLGPKGTFSEEAVFKCFGHSCEVFLAASIDLFSGSSYQECSVWRGSIRKFNEGAVARTLDLFVVSELKSAGR